MQHNKIKQLKLYFKILPGLKKTLEDTFMQMMIVDMHQ